MAQNLPIAAIGLIAEPKTACVAILAVAAGHVFFGDDEIPLAYAPVLGSFATDLGDDADVLMAHDAGRLDVALVRADVAAADSDRFYL